MGDSKNITATNSRLLTDLERVGNHVYNNQNIPQQINDAVSTVQLRTGVVTKFYHYLDKAEVKLTNVDERVVCKVLHRFGGGLIDFFTPVVDEYSFCDKLKEPCIIPRGDLHCVVARLSDEDSSEDLILGYYLNEEIVGFNPAQPGCLKLMSMGGVNQYWIKFGEDGLDIRLPSESTTQVGLRDEEMVDSNYLNSNDTYSKEELLDIFKDYDERIKYLEDLIGLDYDKIEYLNNLLNSDEVNMG